MFFKEIYMDRFFYFNNVYNEMVALDNPDFFNFNFTMPVIIREVDLMEQIRDLWQFSSTEHFLTELEIIRVFNLIMHLSSVNIMNLINELFVRFILDIANWVYVTNRI